MPRQQPRIEEYDGPHRDLIDSFLEAEDSRSRLDAYLDLGRVWVARDQDGRLLGHLQAVAEGDGTWEVTNTAVTEEARGRGIGRALLEHAVSAARADGAGRMVLATAAADVGALRFYQRCGFRMTRVVQDAFVPQTGYPEGIEVDGIPMRDQVWFERAL
jgi:ribosomal protein S18 acetylase RimI-like enzyme